MKSLKKLSLYALIILLISCTELESPFSFPLAECHNISEEGLINAYENFMDVEGALSLIVCREGTIVAEVFTNYRAYSADSIKNIMSVTKTFTGVLVGLAIDKGYIESVNDPIGKYLTGIVTFPDNDKTNITIDQLLKMSFGHSWNGTTEASLFEECFFGSEDNLQYIINLPLVNTPGTTFNYSDGASHLLSAIITEATGMNTADFAKYYLLDPLGITKFTWTTDNRGYPLGAAYLRIKPADMVKFGNLILNRGEFNGNQVLPAEWIDKMTTTMILTNNAVPYGPEYGYQTWLGTWSGHRYYMAMGWGGQFIVVVPDQNLVVTATCWTSEITYQQAGEHWMSIAQIIFEQVLPCVN